MSQIITLADLKPGLEAEVMRFTASSPSLTRLLEMGLVPATRVRMVRRAPLGEPLEIRFRSSSIAIRSRDAREIEVRLDTEGE